MTSWIIEPFHRLNTQAQEACNEAVHREPLSLMYVPNCFKTLEMCERAIEDEPDTIEFVPDCFKNREMCEKDIEDCSYMLEDVPDHFKTQKMCDVVVMKDSLLLRYVLDQYKAREVCEKAFGKDSSSLGNFPEWFVIWEWVCMWYDESDYWPDDENDFFKWYESYKKRKAGKAKIKEELMPFACHPSRWWDWCMPEDGKNDAEKIWL